MSEGTVIDKVKKRIGELEQAIQRLDFVKRHLNQNSSEIKTQIHTSISRHLETLRNREVFLLDQVDKVLVGKEDVLQRQQARLNKALGILHSSFAHATDADDETATRHLVQALEELNAAELKAEETPYIAFRADHVALRESILSYGRVDANGMPLLSAFADENKPSASLPRHVEEYEDTEHHLFYKALQDIKASSSSIRVTMPKLSSRVEDWLQQPVLQLSTAASDSKTPTSETVGTPMSQTTCAIQNWLSEIKHNPDVEDDDDFEIVDHSGSSQKESPMEEEMKPLVTSEQAGLTGIFRHIPHDQRQWLLKGGGNKSAFAAEEDLRAFFRHIPCDTNVWLATARRQLESLDELKRGRWFSHIPTETSSWLKRVHDKRVMFAQTAVPDMFAHISRNKSTWLKEEAPAAGETEVQEDKPCLQAGAEGQDSFQSTPSAPLRSVMKEHLTSSPSGLEFWLLPQEGGAAAASSAGGFEGLAGLSTLPGIQKYLNSNNSSSWLASSYKGELNLEPPTAAQDFFSHISMKQSDWLKDDQTKGGQPDPSEPIDFRKIGKGGKKYWLKSKSSGLTEKSGFIPASPLGGLQQSLSHMSMSDWLLGGELHDSDGTESDRSWRVLSDTTEPSPLSSLQSWTMPDRQIPPLDLSVWSHQKVL